MSGFRPIGLDIGHSSIKMLQLAVKDGFVRLAAADSMRFDSNSFTDEKARQDAVVSSIKQMRSRGRFRGKDVVSCLANEKVKITSLRLTEPDGPDIERVLRKEAVQRFGMDQNIDCINYVRAGDVRVGDDVRSELILFAVDNATIKSHIEMIERAGLQPVGIDIVPCALFRSFERSLRRQEDKEKTVVFVDVGSCFTTVVFGRAGRISFVKQIPIGTDGFDREVSEKLSVSITEAQMLRISLQQEKPSPPDACQASSDVGETEKPLDARSELDIDASTRQGIVDSVGAVAEQLAREIALCLRYYTVTFRGKRVDSANVTGGGSYEPILLNVLRRFLTVDVLQAQPFRGFDISQAGFDGCGRGLDSEWAVAVGLALKGCSEDT